MHTLDFFSNSGLIFSWFPIFSLSISYLSVLLSVLYSFINVVVRNRSWGAEKITD